LRVGGVKAKFKFAKAKFQRFVGNLFAGINAPVAPISRQRQHHQNTTLSIRKDRTASSLKLRSLWRYVSSTA
jgi:hypothetical protein